MPGLANLWLILLKDTALVSAIGLSDILRQAGVAARVTREAFLFFGVAALIYLALAIVSSFGIGAIERAVGQQEAAPMTRSPRLPPSRPAAARPRLAARAHHRLHAGRPLDPAGLGLVVYLARAWNPELFDQWARPICPASA